MANIKRNKGIKGPTIAICSIATVALVGVGFAAWVISGSSSESIAGNIQVDVVNDTSYPIVLQGWKDNKDSIVFGIPEGSENDTDSSSVCSHASWLSTTKDDGLGYENLSVTLNFNVYNVEAGDDLSQILDVTFDTQSTDYTSLDSYTKGYVSGLPNKEDGTLKLTYLENGANNGSSYTEVGSSTGTSLSEDDIIASTDSSNPGYYVACQATAEFSWGEAFGGLNPYEFSYYVEQYQTSGSTDTVITSEYLEGSDYDVITTQLLFSQALEQLETDFGTGIEFVLTITAGANS